MEIQVPSPILTRTITSAADLTHYTSLYFSTEQYREKFITVFINELYRKFALAEAAQMANLWVWVSLSNDGTNYTAIGGQTTPADYSLSGAPAASTVITPLNPIIVPATWIQAGTAIGYYQRQFRYTIPWSVHSRYALLNVKQPVAGLGFSGNAQGQWAITAHFGGSA